MEQTHRQLGIAQFTYPGISSTGIGSRDEILAALKLLGDCFLHKSQNFTFICSFHDLTTKHFMQLPL